MVEPVRSWVLDTNVVVSALLSPAGPPGRLVDMVLARKLRISLDERIESEYREVLSRSKLAIEPSLREGFLAVLRFQDWVTGMPWPHTPPPDHDDLMFLEAAAATRDRLLITGNVQHYPQRCRGDVAILSPSRAWRRFLTSQWA